MAEARTRGAHRTGAQSVTPLRIVALALALLAAFPAGAQRVATESVVARDSGPDLITLNFANADIDSVVKAMSGITGKNFVVDPRVRGTINIVSASPVPRSAVYDVFLSALRVQGIAAVEDRGVVRIVPESEAKLHPGPTFGPHDKPRGGGDQIQTRVFTLQHESAAQLVAVLRPLIAPSNTIAAYPNTNSLIVTDYASNLRRIERSSNRSTSRAARISPSSRCGMRPRPMSRTRWRECSPKTRPRRAPTPRSACPSSPTCARTASSCDRPTRHGSPAYALWSPHSTARPARAATSTSSI
jgi:hypothetical protein